MRNAWIWIVVVVVVIGGGLLWWQNSQQNSVATETPTVNQVNDYGAAPDTTTPADVMSSSTQEATTSAAAPTVSAKEIIVTNQGFKFIPNKITVKKGDTVKITYNNAGGSHNLKLDGFGESAQTKIIKSGESDSFTFTADKAGTFPFYCEVGNHRAMGMEGKLTVTP